MRLFVQDYYEAYAAGDAIFRQDMMSRIFLNLLLLKNRYR